MAKRIILDCDPGTDDAMAILLLLYADKRGLIKLEQIHLVNGNIDVDHSQVTVARLLEAAGRKDIPVYVGCKTQLLLREKEEPEAHFHGEDGFGDLNLTDEPDKSVIKPELSPLKLAEELLKTPGEITVAATGPLTNLGIAIRLYPDICNAMKELWIMGGNDSAVGNITRVAEFNMFGDPEAAQIVLESVKCPMYMLTWETCLKANIPTDWRFNVVTKDKTDPLFDLVTKAEKSVSDKHGNTEWVCADAFLAASMLWPDTIIKKTSKFFCAVELRGHLSRGMMVLDHMTTNEPNLTIINEIHAEAFKALIDEATSPIKLKGCACANNPARNK